MRASFWILAVGCLFLPAGLRAEETKADADFVGPVLDRVARMGAADQQAWLGRLEQRAQRAARLTLGPAEAANVQARLAARLHQKMIAWSALREAVEETNRREREAIDALARRYRSRVLDALHKQLDAHDRWQVAWTAVYGDWKAAGGQFHEQDRLIDWLEAAIRSLGAEQIGAIPARPRFEKQLPSPEIKVVKQPAKPANPQADKTWDDTWEETKQPQKEVKREARAEPQTVEKPAEIAKAPVAANEEKNVPAQAGEKVEVNVDELAARIAGSNLGFRTLEGELHGKGSWDAARLEPLAERLQMLVTRYADLKIFCELLPEGRRATVGRLEPPRSAISELGARIFEARKLASGQEFKGTEAERRAELDRLDALSHRLAELGEK